MHQYDYWLLATILFSFLGGYIGYRASGSKITAFTSMFSVALSTILNIVVGAGLVILMAFLALIFKRKK